MALLENDSQLPKLLMEIGYVATGAGFNREAVTIFEGVAALRPDSEMPWIGLAVVELNGGRPNEARRLLQNEALRRAPQNETAKSFLGLALKQAGHSAESFAILNEVADHGRDAAARAMASGLLGRNI
jgi:Flp pilus assembly protein TadD